MKSATSEQPRLARAPRDAVGAETADDTIRAAAGATAAAAAGEPGTEPRTEAMLAVFLGAGDVSRHLLGRLGDAWDVTLVDESAERLAGARDCRERLQLVEGDGSSRLVLRRAGIERARALVAASDDDDLNLEACRLARESGVRRLAAVVHDAGRLREFTDLGVAACSPGALAARRIELGLETRRVTSSAFFGGRAEAIEFRVTRDAPVCGKALADLHAKSWIVGAVLRDERVFVPHGNTVLRDGDQVTVVGAGSDFAEIVRTFTSVRARFPLGYGKRVAVALERPADLEGAFAEAVQLVRGSRASSLVVVHRDPDTLRDELLAARVRETLARAADLAPGIELRLRPVAESPRRALASLPASESVGVLVLPATRAGGLFSWWRTLAAAAMVRRTGRPVLLSRGSHPYGKILVPARRTATASAAVHAAIDLARFSRAELHALSVVDPEFISGPHDPLAGPDAIAWIEEEAALHGVATHGIVRRGNPVRILLEQGRENDLAVLGVGPRHRRFSMRIAVAELVARRSHWSVLIVPSSELAEPRT